MPRPEPRRRPLPGPLRAACAALLAWAAAAGCSGSGAAEQPAGAAGKGAGEATTFGVCAPDAGWEPCGCAEPAAKAAGHPSARRDAGVPQTDDDVRVFLRRLGEACGAGDLAFVQTHVRFPLAWREIVNENLDRGAPITEPRRAKDAKALCAARAFDGIVGVDPASPDDAAAPASKLRETGARCRVETTIGQFGAALEVEKSGSEWMLTGIERAP
jgi:hypothetical protein